MEWPSDKETEAGWWGERDASRPTDERIARLAVDTLRYVRKRDYCGPDYPRDIHAAAQGILVFTYAGEIERARRIVGWTLTNLHVGDGSFYYRKYRYHTRRVVLMRWCQAWMAYATTEFLWRRHLDHK